MGMRSFAVLFVGCVGMAAISTMAGCGYPPSGAPAPVAQVCPPGAPWVPDGYANGKFVPGHCLGQAAQ
jgi:hypothetical protein